MVGLLVYDSAARISQETTTGVRERGELGSLQ
jgi:hypothetical protein